ncbi:MAG: hypothetical protein AABY22_08135 [Nanoarchaeota archaeon]
MEKDSGSSKIKGNFEMARRYGAIHGFLNFLQNKLEDDFSYSEFCILSKYIDKKLKSIEEKRRKIRLR